MLLFRGGDKMESAHFRYINFMMVYFICPSSSLDIPELDESFWKNAVQNPFYKPTEYSYVNLPVILIQILPLILDSSRPLIFYSNNSKKNIQI